MLYVNRASLKILIILWKSDFVNAASKNVSISK